MKRASSSVAIVSSTPDGSGISPGCSRAPARIVSRQSLRVSWASQGRIAASFRSFGEILVRAGEDLLEHVLGVRVGRPERLDRDRVDVAGEAIDELAPRVVVSRAAAGDELCVGFGDGHAPNESAIAPFRARFEPPGGTSSRARPRAPRQFEVDVVRAGDLHRVLELVAMLEELPEAPCSVVELFGGQLLVRVQRLEDGEADFAVVELRSGASWRARFRPFCAPP